MDVGLQQPQQPLDRQVVEHDDVVDAAEGGDELRAIGGGLHRTPFALQRSHRRIVVHRDNQPVAFGRRALQIAHVADVQEVEAAVGERERPPGRAIARDGFDKFVLSPAPLSVFAIDFRLQTSKFSV